MAFTLQTWGRVSTTLNEPTGTAGLGAPRKYSYITADTQATVAAAGYFPSSGSSSIANDLNLGDEVSVYSSTDLNQINYLVTAVIAGTPNSITLGVITGLQTATVTVTNAQMLAGIFAVPVQIIPSPGANRVIVMQSATIAIVWNSIQFANGGAVRLQYDNTVHAGGTNAMGTTVAAADINNAVANNFQLLLGAAQAWGLNTALGNKGIFISAATGEFTAGDSALKVSALYRIASLT